MLDVLVRVADEYRVALVHVDDLQIEAERHGAPLPEDARPSAGITGDDFLMSSLMNSYRMYFSPMSSIGPLSAYFRGV